MLNDLTLYGLVRSVFADRLGLDDLPDHPDARPLNGSNGNVVCIRYLIWDTINGYRQKVWIEGRWNTASNTFSFVAYEGTSIRKMREQEFALLCQLQVKPGGTLDNLTSDVFLQYLDGLLK